MKQKKKSKSFDQRISKETSLLYSVALAPKPCQGFFSSILFHEFALLSLLGNFFSVRSYISKTHILELALSIEQYYEMHHHKKYVPSIAVWMG